MLFVQAFSSVMAAALFSSARANASPDPLSLLGGLVNLNPNILQGGHALINLGVLANVLGPQNCSDSAVIGVKANLNLLNLVSVCACVEVLNTGTLPVGTSPCPACPANAHRICATATCGCECDDGFFAYNNGTQICVPNANCAAPNKITQLASGQSACSCSNQNGYVSDLRGGCVNVNNCTP